MNETVTLRNLSDFSMSVEPERCVIFLRSGRTVKVSMSRQEVMSIINASDDLLVEIDGCTINVEAIDSIEPVSRINREEN